MKIAIRKLPHARDLALPAYASAGAAGLDLLAAVENPLTSAPGRVAAVPTGIALALPKGYEAQVRPRSVLALKNAITVLNAPGTVDSDYRGEIAAILINLGREDFTVTRGMKIAQMVIAAHADIEWEEADTLETTARGVGGFGSSGMGV
jgi:dUTP pyrophosphatase